MGRQTFFLQVVKRNSKCYATFIHFTYEPRATCPAHRLMEGQQQSQLRLGEACSLALTHPGRQEQGPAWMERQSGWLSHTHTHNLLLLSSNTLLLSSNTHCMFTHSDLLFLHVVKTNPHHPPPTCLTSHLTQKKAWCHSVPKQVAFPLGKSCNHNAVAETIPTSA